MQGEILMMVELITKIDDKMGEPIIEERRALSRFCYESGYIFLGEDLGNRGVKIQLTGGYEDGRAIILPPEKARECGRWLLRTIGKAKYKLPKELLGILERLIERKGFQQRLRRGDKKIIAQALKVLKNNGLCS